MCNLQNMIKNNDFDQKCIFLAQILELSTCTHLHHSDLDSGQRYLKMTKNSLHTPKLRIGAILLDNKLLYSSIYVAFGVYQSSIVTLESIFKPLTQRTKGFFDFDHKQGIYISYNTSYAASTYAASTSPITPLMPLKK